MIFLCLLAYFAGTCLPKWTDPFYFLNSTYPLNLYSAIRLLTTNHLLFSFAYRDKELVYAQMNEERVNVFSTLFIHNERITNPIISGAENNLFVVFNTDPNITFMESKNKGETWKIYPSFTKYQNCTVGAMHYITEAGRLFVVYFCGLNVLYVSRPLKSDIFAKEIIVFESNEEILEITACYTMKKHQALVHIVWTTKSRKVMITASSNNGVSWDTPEEMDFRSSTIQLFANTMVSNTVFIFFNDDQMKKMVYSTDNCDTFSKEHNVSDQLFGINILLCGTKDGGIMTTASGRNSYYQWFGWERKELERIPIATPFKIEHGVLSICNPVNPFEIRMYGYISPYGYASATRDWRDK